MPLTRYQIRNEYSLADPELYKAADKDDPEALLEGVAMAGLVGVLRQLGDLAEFAAEIFHGLHEEVMTTAARGHGLMARVQQLEAEFPSIEKAFLSQTNHSPFFSSSGVDCHPNLQMEQNLIARGDLPRFVMDSYEECRGPPQLFLLDKFDVAGAGACLKRYTDPSFFKVETASSGIATVEVQREKKIRKKKKGSRYRNGETLEVQTSRTKLHELLLQEHFENGHSDPARLVKLKRRQINGSPFDLKPGKSYMEKFVLTPSPERKQVCEDSVTRSPLKFTLDNSSESGYEIHEVSVVSPAKKSLNGVESSSSSPSEQEAMLKPVKDELDREAVDSGIIMVFDPIVDRGMDELPPTVYKMAIEEELLVDADIKREGTVDGDHSDDMASEVDNYMDALTTMDSEMETDNEYKAKNAQDLIDMRTQGADSDANEEQLDFQANSSDSQSIGNSSLSEGGNSLFKKGTSSSSYSDTLCNLVENTASDVEGAGKWFPSATSTENHAANVTDLPSDHPPVYAETGITESHHLDTREDKIPDPVEASCSSCPADSNPVFLLSVPAARSMASPLTGPELVEASSGSAELGSKSPHCERNGLYLTDSFIALTDIPSQMGHDASLPDSSKSHSVDVLDHEDPDILTDALVHVLNMSDLASEKKVSDDSVNEVLQTDCAAEHSTLTPAEEQFPHSALPVVELDSGVPSLPGNSKVVKPDGLVSKADDEILMREGSAEISTTVVDTLESECINEHPFSDVTADASQEELDSTKLRLPCSEENVKLEEISEGPDSEEKNAFTKKVDITRGDATYFEHESCISDKPTPEDHVNLADDVTETVQAEDIAVSTAATSGVDAEEKNAFTKKVDITRGGATSFEHESCISDKPTPEDHVNLADDVTETVQAEDMAVSTAATSGVDAEERNAFVKKVDMTRGDANYFEHESCSSDIPTPEDHVNLADDVTETVKTEDMAVSTAATSGVEAEEKNAFTKKVDITRGGATSFEDESCSDKPTPEDHVNLADDVTETVKTEAMAVSTAAPSGVNNEDVSNVIILSSELVCSPPRNSTEMVESLSISEDPNQTSLNLDEVTSAKCLSESQVKMEVTSTDWDSSSYKPVSEDYQNQEVIEVHNPSSEVSNQESESKDNHQSHCGEVGDNPVCSPVCYPPESGNGLEQSIELQADQISAESMLANGASSLLSSQNSSAGYLLGPGIPPDHTSELQSDQLDRRCLKSGEASSTSADVQSEQIQNLHNITDERCPEPSSLKDLSSQEFLLQSACQGHNVTDQAINPFDSAFPSFGALPVPETSQVNPEAMPPLPPLPPMQWRLGKIQPGPPDADRDMMDHSQPTSQPIETFIVDQKVQFDFPALDREIVHPSNPFLSLPVEDSQRSQHLTTELMGNSLLPTTLLSGMPTIDNDAQYQQDDLLSDRTQSVNSSLALSEMPGERHEHGFLQLGGESMQFSSNPFSLEPGINDTAAVNDSMLRLFSQSAPETGLEVKFPGQSSQNAEGEQENSSGESAVPLNTEEEQHHHDFVTSHGLPIWPPTTLGMTPPTYEVGKTNGKKIPRPRNPLIDAVAALDKSKLRKVAERVRPQLGPKLEERDSLLEQIRTKSFNLKPATVTRPSMQGVQGPKTNLKVAAILEKANAIRQALTGSDEDDDSDSWSDS
ncbi:PREDICTED: protein SCAR2-like isoform X2 [Populus euphratica]|uniref:Protein SCAR n=1 Tax=Populus euphratica TaxID=75702 RepID=A0AAJ6UMQ1_POPEU|nr:PREDICTED: protein SCAR2-like isoform X2 [Populus euphratica]